MRSPLAILGFVVVPVLAVAAGACDNPPHQLCPDEELLCTRELDLVCKKFLFTDAETVPVSCCTFGRDASTATPKSDAATITIGDGSLPLPDVGSPLPVDAGTPGKDAGKGKYPPLGNCGDGGWPYDVDAGWFYGLMDGGIIPAQGLDDAGGVHLYECYIDICNPPHWSWDGGIWQGDSGLWWLFPGDAARSNCGPTGCQ